MKPTHSNSTAVAEVLLLANCPLANDREVDQKVLFLRLNNLIRESADLSSSVFPSASELSILSTVFCTRVNSSSNALGSVHSNFSALRHSCQVLLNLETRSRSICCNRASAKRANLASGDSKPAQGKHTQTCLVPVWRRLPLLKRTVLTLLAEVFDPSASPIISLAPKAFLLLSAFSMDFLVM